jgi:hypothetical protein
MDNINNKQITDKLNKIVNLMSEIENRLIITELKINALSEKEQKYINCDICDKKHLDIYGKLYDLGLTHITKDIYLDPCGFYIFCAKCANDFIAKKGKDKFKKIYGCDGPNQF